MRLQSSAAAAPPQILQIPAKGQGLGLVIGQSQPNWRAAAPQ